MTNSQASGPSRSSAQPFEALSQHEFEVELSRLEQRYAALKDERLDLDLTRGKPSAEQLALSSSLDGILQGDYLASDGTETRGYGGLDGIPEAKRLGALLLGLPPSQIIVGGNSSLTMMYLYLMHAQLHGPADGVPAWRDSTATPRFLCPVPGYDRHFSACADLGIALSAVPMTDEGPDMDQVESALRDDPDIRGIWCVPKYANPSGITYSNQTVDRIAALAGIANPGFRVMWDNAYTVHHLYETGDSLANMWEISGQAGTRDSIVWFGSTSKITFAGAGLAFVGGSEATLTSFRRRLEMLTIGPDKVNQLRHAKLLPDEAALRSHMRDHAAIIEPKFGCVRRHLESALGDRGLARWTNPRGGYFVCVDTQPGLARKIVALAGEAGVKLTPAGAAFPYGDDPEDCNIRLAPTFPALADVDKAMEVFVTCVQLATARRLRDQS